MKNKLLLPRNFKKIGWVLFPIGLILWIIIQRGIVTPTHSIKVGILSTSFFSFIIGIYFISFSKEKIEDEYISSLRLKAFQISSLIQMLFFIVSFTCMYLFKYEPNGDGGLSAFLLLSILLFWISYLISFNYTLITNKSKLDD